MAESQHARRERIAAQVFAALATQHSDDMSYNARRAMLAADAFLKEFDAAYGQPAEASPSLLEAAKEVVGMWSPYSDGNVPNAVLRLRAAIAREEAARG